MKSFRLDLGCFRKKEKEPIKCPKRRCKSTNVKPIEVEKYGYSVGLGLAALLFLGPLGLLAGLLGKDEAKATWWVCLDCGNRFKT